jgi:8-oxo-dGTP pyrophosphatase MutT (NUDIX family)
LQLLFRKFHEEYGLSVAGYVTAALEEYKKGLRPAFSFTVSDAAKTFNVPTATFLENSTTGVQRLVASALVFCDDGGPRKTLLIQRSSTDENNPNMWESPGGGVEDDDASVLFAAAREVWEETGLEVSHFRYGVGEEPVIAVDRKDDGVVWGWVLLDVDVTGYDVILNPREHQRFLWATKEEVEQSKAGSTELQFASPIFQANALRGFRLRNIAEIRSGRTVRSDPL